MKPCPLDAERYPNAVRRNLWQVRDDITCDAQFYLSNPGPDAVNPNPARCQCNRGFRGEQCKIECYGGASNECVRISKRGVGCTLGQA